MNIVIHLGTILEFERDYCCYHQSGLYRNISKSSQRGYLLLHHCPLHAPRLLRHVFCSSSQCESYEPETDWNGSFILLNYLQRFYRYHEQLYQKSVNENKKSVIYVLSYWNIFKKCFPQLVNIFLVFFVTLSLFPAVLSGQLTLVETQNFIVF